MITVTHTIGDLADDLRSMAVRVPAEEEKAVRKVALIGNALAKGFAKESAGRHGKHYHKAFTAERVGTAEWEYGPDAAMPQGGMSFEFGSRNQPPHLDLARSADLAGPRLSEEAQALLDRLFWP